MMDGKITGNICYCFTFSIYDETAGLGPDQKTELKKSILSNYPNAVFDDDPRAGQVAAAERYKDRPGVPSWTGPSRFRAFVCCCRITA